MDAGRCGNSGVHLEADDPLDDGQREADQVPGELQGEAVCDLVVEAEGCDGVLDGLVEVALVRIEGFGREAVRKLVHPAPLRHDVEDALGNDPAAAEAGIEGADAGLEVGREPDCNDLDGGVDDGGHPVVQVRPHDSAKQRANHAASREREHVGDTQGDGDSLRELELQGRDDGDPDVDQGGDRLLQFHGILHRHHGDLGLVIDEVVRGHVLNIHDSILVGVNLVIFEARLRGA
mmetsp:Transcript_27840/g.92548  ORF Transcript_27840/g.92548 Transcript_27840/m.92548 type:complete len:234 (+) Transcript_27840:112-813(+)